MTKLVLVLSFVGLAITLAFGLLDPSNPVMWLASTTTSFEVLRAALMVIIFALLVTEPPRNAYLRAFVGIVSIALMSWSLSSVYQNHMPIADAMLMIAIGLSMGITVLERNYLFAASHLQPATVKA